MHNRKYLHPRSLQGAGQDTVKLGDELLSIFGLSLSHDRCDSGSSRQSRLVSYRATDPALSHIKYHPECTKLTILDQHSINREEAQPPSQTYPVDIYGASLPRILDYFLPLHAIAMERYIAIVWRLSVRVSVCNVGGL